MISTETLKQYLNIDGTGKDTFLGVCLASASGEVESYCNRKFEYGSYTDYLDGNCNSKFLLKNYPIIEVNGIEVKSGNEWKSYGDSTCQVIYSINAVLLDSDILPRGKNNIRVNYTAGWNEDECNDDLKGVLLEMATLNYFNSPLSGQARLGKRSENMTSQASTSSGFKDLDWKEKVNRYRVRLTK